MATNKINYTANDRAIVDALKNAPEGLTLAGLCAATGLELKPGHLVHAMGKGLIEAIGDVEIVKPAKRKVNTYNFVSGDFLSNADGKPFNYTDNEKEVLKVAATIDSPFTLADLAVAMGVEKLASGRINGLVSKGNISKGDQVEVACTAKGTVRVYGFVADIPADAE